MWEYSHDGKQLENKWVFRRLQKTGKALRGRSHGSMSVFQVGIGFSVYRSVFFYVVGISKYCDIGLVFSVFHFATKCHVQIVKFCFRVSPWIFTKDPCLRSRRW